ncbi:MAG: hypothetical protein AAFR66_20685 [Bacteroidota bacterium]
MVKAFREAVNQLSKVAESKAIKISGKVIPDLCILKNRVIRNIKKNPNPTNPLFIRKVR